MWTPFHGFQLEYSRPHENNKLPSAQKLKRNKKEIHVKSGNLEPSWEDRSFNEQRNLVLGFFKVMHLEFLFKKKVELKNELDASPNWRLSLKTENSWSKKAIGPDEKLSSNFWNESHFSWKKTALWWDYQSQILGPIFGVLRFQK